MFEKTILIVDDEEMVLMMTEGILSTKYNILKATSGQQALEICENTRPDMIILDYMMPDMDGFETADKIRERFGRGVPIIFMTASESEEVQFQGLGKGAVDYLRKPLKANVLLSSVDDIMERLEQARRMGS